MENTLIEQQSHEVPWTIQQTFLGILLTLVPWSILALGLSSQNASSSLTAPLPPQADLINAIIVFLFSTLIEVAFLVAPFYFANATLRSLTVEALRPRTVLRVLGFRAFNVGSALS